MIALDLPNNKITMIETTVFNKNIKNSSKIYVSNSKEARVDLTPIQHKKKVVDLEKTDRERKEPSR